MPTNLAEIFGELFLSYHAKLKQSGTADHITMHGSLCKDDVDIMHRISSKCSIFVRVTVLQAAAIMQARIPCISQLVEIHQDFLVMMHKPKGHNYYVG